MESISSFYILVGVSAMTNALIVPFTLSRFTRPTMICICFVLVALFYCLLSYYKNFEGISFGVSCLCSAVLQIAYVVISLYIIEMFPTKVRASALNICHSIAFVMQICNSLIEQTTVQHTVVGPYLWIVYIGVILVMAIVCLFINDTGNVPLPDTQLQAIINF